ncbi:hypothetical protein M407DRAFT_29007 [Tulasnella calospora MUT 4182]|uniref:Uncharacterized protein n=1 Tax=Tulasnella calospora MUT 4182 TaxID=1051891 RepID=A0A0C3LJ41_9AGAM|nr:hypothetical protein M407DRAFT_29007 [Tulasnella calospora MUT 4182]
MDMLLGPGPPYVAVTGSNPTCVCVDVRVIAKKRLRAVMNGTHSNVLTEKTSMTD